MAEISWQGIAPFVKTGQEGGYGRSDSFRLPSCLKIFESGSEIFSNLRIRLLLEHWKS